MLDLNKQNDANPEVAYSSAVGGLRSKKERGQILNNDKR
jgi:hypothetical protein